MVKILILSSGIHNEHGSGITLKNLFNKLPKDNICIITNRSNGILSLQNGYKNVYILGKKSGDIHEQESITKTKKSNNKTLIQFITKKTYRIKDSLKKLKHLLIQHGFYYQFSRHKLNDDLIEWLKKQAPTSIYSVGQNIPLTIQIQKFLNIPIVLHIMDDWISTEIKPGPLAFYWKKILNKLLSDLITISKEHVAISNKMAVEYEKRYAVKWKVFHNPLVVYNWLPYQKKSYDIDGVFKIAFFGRKTTANSYVINILESIFTDLGASIPLEFHLFTQVKANNSQYIFYHDFISHEILPKVMQEYDLLILPFIFDDYWTKYACLSMPTKLSEYLISGVPVLLISPQNTALYEFCVENKCCFISEQTNYESIKKSLYTILENKSLREEIAAIGKKIAIEKFDVEKVSNDFVSLFS